MINNFEFTSEEICWLKFNLAIMYNNSNDLWKTIRRVGDQNSNEQNFSNIMAKLSI